MVKHSHTDKFIADLSESTSIEVAELVQHGLLYLLVVDMLQVADDWIFFTALIRISRCQYAYRMGRQGILITHFSS